jgi:hypothetical protein
MRPWTVNKVFIENLHTDRLDIHIAGIDVGELSGRLNVGLNCGGRLLSIIPGQHGEQPPGPACPAPSAPVPGKPVIKFKFGP